jgi:hypothetical protein
MLCAIDGFEPIRRRALRPLGGGCKPADNQPERGYSRADSLEECSLCQSNSSGIIAPQRNLQKFRIRYVQSASNSGSHRRDAW